MNKNKEIIVFSCGNSNDISTWSNVPYLFTKTLEEKGYKINRVDISPNKTLNRLFNTTSFYLFRKILKLNACPEFHRTFLHRIITYQKIKKATKQYPDALFNLFLSFAFYNKFSEKPSVLWCDWTDRVVIERLGREPKFYEKASLRHEDNVMKSADKVYTMFPDCKKHLEELYGREILYLNQNVINTVFDGEFNIEDNIKTRENSNKILFIGNHRYLGAAQKLVAAYKELKKENSTLELHLIGLTRNEIKCNDNGIFCYGYLRKNIESEKDTYYRLIQDCRVFVNPAEQWGGYSSSVEAMFYGSPIIVAPYKDFVTEFGEDIDFGYYTKGNDLTDNIRQCFQAPKDAYRNFCLNAHNHVKDYTWSNYVDKFLQSLKDENILL